MSKNIESAEALTHSYQSKPLNRERTRAHGDEKALWKKKSEIFYIPSLKNPSDWIGMLEAQQDLSRSGWFVDGR